MSLQELYEERDQLRVEKYELQTQGDELKAKMKDTSLPADEATKISSDTKVILDKINEFLAREKTLTDKIKQEEDHMSETVEAAAADSAAARIENHKSEVFDSKKYLESREALEDFAQVLMDTAGQGGQKTRDAWKQHMRVKDNIINPELLYPVPVARAITDAFENSGAIFATFRKLPFTKWKAVFSEDLGDDSRAHQHNPGKDKLEQKITLKDRILDSEYIYKYITIDKKVLRETQSTGAIINYVLSELPQRIVWEIERAAIIGDGRASGAEGKITSYVPVAGDDAQFVADVTATNDLYVDIVTAMAKIKAGGNRYLVMGREDLAQMKIQKGDDGHFLFPPSTDFAGLFGVAAIFTPQWFAGGAEPGTVRAVAYVGASYGVVGDDTIQNYENFILAKNKEEYLAELYTGGGLFELESAATVTYPEGGGKK